jgi:ribose 5-phosphate isomerase B
LVNHVPGLYLVGTNNTMKKIEIGADHAGFELKTWLVQELKKRNLTCEDHGTYSMESVDYPDYAHATAMAVLKTEGKGILICGSANGVCMTANKHVGIRAALCWNEEVTILARQHNNANMLCLPARFISNENALKMVDLFLTTDFEGGRHAKRVDKING